MPRGGCLSAAATHRTPTRRDSRGRSIWSWSVSSTTPTLALDAAASPSRFRSDRRASEAVPVTLLRVASASVLPRAGPTGLHRTGVGQSTDSIGRPTSIRSWLDPPFLVSRVHGSPATAARCGASPTPPRRASRVVPTAVDADAPPSWFHAHRPTSPAEGTKRRRQRLSYQVSIAFHHEGPDVAQAGRTAGSLRHCGHTVASSGSSSEQCGHTLIPSGFRPPDLVA